LNIFIFARINTKIMSRQNKKQTEKTILLKVLILPLSLRNILKEINILGIINTNSAVNRLISYIQ